MPQKETTGRTISRLGVLTVLTENFLSENHLDSAERARLIKQRDAILMGQAGVEQKKVVVRSAERCASGGGHGGMMGMN